MGNYRHRIFSSPYFIYLIACTTIVLAIISINVEYFHYWENNVDIPIPDPFTENFIIYQSFFVVIINGFIHFSLREKKYKSSFEYVKWIVILLIANTFICFVATNIQMMPSINEIKRLYGTNGVPHSLYWLSIPIALISSLLSIFGIHYLAILFQRKKQNQSKIKEYQIITLNLFKSYLLVVLIILTVNFLYYQMYIQLGGALPKQGFHLTDLLQMTFVLTAIAAILFLYFRDNSENGLSIYIILTLIISFSSFMAGLSREDGQPVFDETLVLNVPISLVSLVGELVGIPYFFKNLMKPLK